jgi:spoIIIJ-associated protein
MVKIEASNLEDAYAQAAGELNCSVTQLEVEIVQYPSKGFLGLFSKPAIIVANKIASPAVSEPRPTVAEPAVRTPAAEPETVEAAAEADAEEEEALQPFGTQTNVEAGFFEEGQSAEEIAGAVREDINRLFATACFDIDPVAVSVYDETTLLVEFTGRDAALLIGKEGYRYKALSYMIFNWINTKYQMQLRLEIAEFLKNQEESINRYLVGVCENIDHDGRAQTKILDGVLVQIALRELRERYPEKYVAIRSTRDGSKFIIVNDYHEY